MYVLSAFCIKCKFFELAYNITLFFPVLFYSKKLKYWNKQPNKQKLQ